MAKLTGGRLAAARAFKAARGHKGLSQKSLATASGVALGTIQQLEAGNAWPQAKSQAKLEPCVGMPAGELERIAGNYEEPPTEEHRYPSRARAARILEHEEQLARNEAERIRIETELQDLRGE